MNFKGNLLHLLPPTFCRLRENFIGPKKVLKLERNKLDSALEERRKMGPQHLFNYLASKGTTIFILIKKITLNLPLDYHNLYQSKFDQKPKIDMNERRKEKSKKISRVKWSLQKFRNSKKSTVNCTELFRSQTKLICLQPKNFRSSQLLQPHAQSAFNKTFWYLFFLSILK